MSAGGPPPLPQPLPPRTAPDLGGATLAIVGYFLLQLLAVLPLALVLALSTAGAARSPAELQRQLLASPALLVGSLALSALPMLWWMHRRWRAWWRQPVPPGFGFTRPARSRAWLLPALALGLGWPLLGGLLTTWLSGGEEITQDVMMVLRHAPPGWLAALVLVIVGLGPLVEEALFRGLLLSALLRHWRTHWAVVASAAAFALVHVPGLTGQWYALPALFGLGVGCALLRLRAGSIWPAVLAHALNNAIAVASARLLLST